MKKKHIGIILSLILLAIVLYFAIGTVRNSNKGTDTDAGSKQETEQGDTSDKKDTGQKDKYELPEF